MGRSGEGDQSQGESAIRRLLEEAESDLQTDIQRSHAGAEPEVPEPEVVGECRVCGGEVVKELRWMSPPFTERTVIGPVRPCGQEVSYYCLSCRLKYEGPPPDSGDSSEE